MKIKLKVTIIGTGLIGGSLALDLKASGFCDYVIGVESNTVHAEQALQRKFALALSVLEKDKEVSSALVFTRTKRGADQVSKFLNGAKIQSEAIHSNKSQNARQRALNNFKSKKTRVLVATDIAARGIDVERLSHVINFEIPNISETYVHRIGRTGRAGLGGVALSFCDEEEREYLRDINGLIKTSIPVINDHPYPMSNSSRSSDGNENRFLYSKAGSIKKSGSSRFFNKKKKHWSRNSKPVGKS
jgi:ATP-dependent RNA helicase RhlE